MIIIRAGGGHPRFFEFFAKKFSQCRKLSHSAENTLFLILIHVLPILIHGLGFRLSAPYLNTRITYLNTLTRLSAPYLNTCIAYLNTLSRLSALGSKSCRTIPYLNTLSRLHIFIHCRNIPYLKTWEGDPSRLSAAIAYLNT